MENLITEGAIGQGIWAILSIYLIFFMLKYFRDDKIATQEINAEREEKLIQQLREFSECLNKLNSCYTNTCNYVEKISTDVKEIKCDVEELKKERE